MRRHLFRVAALLAVAGVMTACTGGGDSPGASTEPAASAKAGYRTVSADGVSLDVPTDWVEATPSSGEVEQKLGYGTTERAGGVPVQSVSLLMRKGEWSDVDSAAGAQSAAALAVIPGSRQTDRREVTVPGAGRGVVTTITFPTPAGPRGTLYDLVAFAPNGQRILVRVTTQDPSAVDTARAVLDSVRLDS